MLARQAAAAARRRAAGRPRKARAERVAIKKGGIPRSFTRKSHVSRERSGHHRARISRRDIVEQRFVGAESSRCLCPPLPLAGGETEAAATGERKSVVEGKSVYVRVHHGGRRNMKKKKKE